MIPAFVWEYKLILRFIIRVNSHLKEALCVFGGSTIQEFTVLVVLVERRDFLKRSRTGGTWTQFLDFLKKSVDKARCRKH
jgi:hypothetical protein